MLDGIYGSSQNYNRTSYELFSHLVEVSGAFAKYLFKRNKPIEACTFLPRMFSWSLAVYQKVKMGQGQIESALLKKFPTVCPYCLQSPCACKGIKAEVTDEDLRKVYLNRSGGQSTTVDEIQLMFRRIYETTWWKTSSDRPLEAIRSVYTRYVEELSELSESIRFHHLYPQNFDNEFADLMAWWFALVSMMNMVVDEPDVLYAGTLLWDMFPGRCPICRLHLCDCRPGPVREVLSKPLLGEMNSLDPLTLTLTERGLSDFLADVDSGARQLDQPTTVMVVDVDSLSNINRDHGRDVGNRVLVVLVNALRQKLRQRDILFRVHGDTFVAFAEDRTVLEGVGLLRRVGDLLPTLISLSDLRGMTVSFSAGVAVIDKDARASIEDAERLAKRAAELGGGAILPTDLASV